jgi:hypothetical protein
VHSEGRIENFKTGEEHYFLGEGVLSFSECSVTKPAGRECVIKGGAITTESLTVTSKGAEMNVEFVGAGAEKRFASITLEGCKNNVPPAASYPVTGSVKVPPSGATLPASIVETKAQGTLKFGGNAAGLEGSLTMSNKENGIPLTVTTPPFTE